MISDHLIQVQEEVNAIINTRLDALTLHCPAHLSRWQCLYLWTLTFFPTLARYFDA